MPACASNRRASVLIVATCVGCGLLMYVHFNARLRLLEMRRKEPAESGGAMHRQLRPNLAGRLMLYNRVPKTASTSVMAVAHELTRRNGFSAVHLNVSRNQHTMTLADRGRFARNASTWRLPALYHGHVAFVDFEQLGWPNPIYMNVVREPLERLVSYYYFMRFGDDHRPHVARRRAGNNETFDECVERAHRDCQPDNLWLQVAFFCGHAAPCWQAGNPWALEQAKRNLVRFYAVVGVTERLAEFIAVLEQSFPDFFDGATALAESSSIFHTKKTKRKLPPSQQTVDKFHRSKIWQMEYEFYEFAKEQFDFVYNRLFRTSSADGRPIAAPREFFYDKVKPLRIDEL